MRIATIIKPDGKLKICKCGNIFFKHFKNSKHIKKAGKTFLVCYYTNICLDCNKREDQIIGEYQIIKRGKK